MNLAERIPSLDDKELRNLLVNARRLENSGTPKQQAEAGELIPLIETELDARKPPSKPKRAAAKPPVAH